MPHSAPKIHVTLHDGRTVRLGRIRPMSRPKALRFGAYFDAGAATWTPPATLDYSAKAVASLSQVYLNDTEGDCVIAGHMHAVGVWTGNESGTPVIATASEVQSAYTTICGPGDQGCVITDVLDYFEATGLTLSGVTHKIAGYVAVDWRLRLNVQTALYLFGALTIGINLPDAWTTAQVWDVTNSRIVGGHDVTIVGWNATGVTLCSWGALYTMTWAALESTVWVEEMYAMLSPDWDSSGDLAPCGVDAATLAADLAKIGAGQLPPIDPTPTPVTPTPVTPTPTPAPGTVPTSLALTPSANPAEAGVPVTFTATVSSGSFSPVPAGGQIVVDIDDSATTANYAVTGGVATFTLPGFTPGPHGVVAKYLGDGTYLVGSPAVVKLTVTPAPAPAPPAVPGLTLAESVAAATSGITAHGVGLVSVARAVAGASQGLKNAWPPGAP